MRNVIYCNLLWYFRTRAQYDSGNASSRDILPQCLDNGFLKMSLTFGLLNSGVRWRHPTLHKWLWTVWHWGCWYLVMVEKTLLHSTLFWFHSWNSMSLKRRWPQTFVRWCWGDHFFQKDMCQMANIRQAKHPGYVANLKEEEAGWFSVVLTAVLHWCTSQTDPANKPLKSSLTFVGITGYASVRWRYCLKL